MSKRNKPIPIMQLTSLRHLEEEDKNNQYKTVIISSVNPVNEDKISTKKERN